MMSREKIKKLAKLELARRDFFYYCYLTTKDFYLKDREYIVKLCNEFQAFYESDDKVLMLNMPPRTGKSRTASKFVEWVLGNNQTEKIMTGSYNETLSTTFSKSVRNNIQEEKADEDIIVFKDVFPKVEIKRGDGSMNLWSLVGGHNNYLATSPTGTATGFGASLMIIDDLIKNYEEACNANIKEQHWEWFTNTMLSRLEEGGKIIIIMTRWASDDLCGRALEEFERQGVKLRHVNMKAMQDDGTMLCEAVLSRETFERNKLFMGEDVVSANYQQEPIDIKGRLYSSLKTYDGELPLFKEIRNYTDTADTGEDYLCSINYGVTFQNEAYILDILYTKAPMEVTEPQTAKMLLDGKVNVADIESNNGGRGFARSVERILREKHGSNYTIIRPFTQHKNKESRINSNATWVMEHIYFPFNWRERWYDFYRSMVTYQREGKNAHDDAQDAITGIVEKVGLGDTYSWD